MGNTVDEIKQRLDIVELLGEYIKLKPAGTNFKAICPFHNEKTPSFVISPDKQIWHCFGCAKGGDIFSFIQNIEGVEFPEALRILAGRAGVRLEYFKPEEHNHKTRLLDLLKAIAGHWQDLLNNDPRAKIARDYLQTRQLKEETVKDFALGFAPDEWEEAIKFLQSKNFSLKEMADAGVTVPGDKGKPYDRFRGRLIFPIRDVHGNVAGFTARKLKEEDHGGKYINSPASVIYNKSEVLYNLDLAKAEIKRLGYAILVEGNMDAVTAWQGNTKNVVAVSGTALTNEQIRLLKRFTQNVMIAFDADPAGTQANLRGIDLAWQAGFNVKVIKIPQGKDPDDLIKQNPELWRQAIREAYNFMDYVFEAALKNLDLTRVDHKKLAAKKILPLLAKLGDSVEQSHYLRKLAEILGVAEEALANTLTGFKTKEPLRQEQPIVSAVPDQSRLVAEYLLALILKFPEQLESVIQHLQPEMIQHQEAAELYKELIIYYNKEHHLAIAELTEQLKPGQADYLNQLSLLVEEDSFNNTPDLLNYEISQSVNRLKNFYLKNRIKELSRLMSQAEKSNDQARVLELSREFTQLTRQLQDV
ncbi:MAG: DNA primase [Candidatus Komeilibacteria bacterium]|nr:DNA primase [Candidatus Komeilibacteria bacterium]